jgi:hypothetical protein
VELVLTPQDESLFLGDAQDRFAELVDGEGLADVRRDVVLDGRRRGLQARVAREDDDGDVVIDLTDLLEQIDAV